MNNKPVDQITIPPEKVRQITPIICKILLRIKQEEQQKGAVGS